MKEGENFRMETTLLYGKEGLTITVPDHSVIVEPTDIKKVENEEVTRIMTNIIKTQKWEKEKVIFMMSVFKDLDFFNLTDRKLQINTLAKKKDLKQSKTYQEKLKQIEAEKTLYYSTFNELYEWFMQWIETTEIKREVTIK